MPNVLIQRFRSSQMSRSASLDGAHPSNSDELTHGCGETSQHTFGAQPASDVISSVDDEANATQADAEHIVDAPAASGSDACASAVSDILQLRNVLGDMTLSQLRALAASWGLPSYYDRARATCSMYDKHQLSRTPNPSEFICLAVEEFANSGASFVSLNPCHICPQRSIASHCPLTVQHHDARAAGMNTAIP